ncbi:unnamed protein product [Closterium sp. Naga37s-1]|nr:unnamed protein product [Closterium sp. Naga37s-1]
MTDATVPEGHKGLHDFLYGEGGTSGLAKNSVTASGGSVIGHVAVMSDATVPEGQKGLHDFLYGEGDVHEDTSTSAYTARPGEDDDTLLSPHPPKNISPSPYPLPQTCTRPHVHEATSTSAYTVRPGEDDGTLLSPHPPKNISPSPYPLPQTCTRPHVHEATSTSAYTVRPGEDDGTLLSAVQDYVAARELQKLAGIYAVYDGAGALQYVGYSRNIVVSLKGHRAAMGEVLCSSVRVQVYRADSMLSRAVLDGERRRWLQELGQSESFMQTSSFAQWEAQGAQVGAAAAAAAEGGELSDGERAEQEERRLRMRKAMGENLMDDEEYRRKVEGGETDGESERRRMQLLQATEGDDWSSVIDGQTQETVAARGGSNGKPSRAAKGEARGATAAVTAPAAAAAQQGSGVTASATAPPSAAPIVSPFARPGAAGTGAAGGVEEAEGEMELTVESADRVLDRVRPYLVADGGNVEVKAVENGVVILELQGACNTCPSSAATMKMGIERALQDAFGEKLKEVMQLGGVDNRLTLAVLQPTLSKYRAHVSAA